MPSRLALACAFIPFIAMAFTVPWWDRIEPRVLGLPFNLAWLVTWIPLSAGCLWAASRIEARRKRPDRAP